MTLNIIIISVLSALLIIGTLLGTKHTPKFIYYLPISFFLGSIAGMKIVKAINENGWFASLPEGMNPQMIIQIIFISIITIGGLIISILVKLLIKLMVIPLNLSKYSSAIGGGIFLLLSGAALTVITFSVLEMFNIYLEANMVTSLITCLKEIL